MKKTPQKVAYLSRNSVWPIEQLYIELGKKQKKERCFVSALKERQGCLQLSAAFISESIISSTWYNKYCATTLQTQRPTLYLIFPVIVLALSTTFIL
jgi:hypothetical protein